MTILDQLAEHARERVAAAKREIPPEEIRARALQMARAERARGGERFFAFEKALKKPGMSFICECKKASPSKGLIAPDFPYLEIARAYEAAGADCISVLTEPGWFLGSDAYLREIAAAVSVPCLRKDFTVDEYMLYEAKVLGASAVLLICSILSGEEIARYIGICDELGMSALVEAHDEKEIRTAVEAGARIIGVNNRNLKDFTVDTQNSRRLRACVPEGILFVAESGVRGPEDVRAMSEAGADAVLVGEALMRAGNKKEMLQRLREGALNIAEKTGSRPRIKFCGLTRPEDILAANSLRADYIGFVFWDKSKRYVTPAQAAQLRKLLAPGIKAVGVFVDEEPAQAAALLEVGIIDMAQLHGDESEAYISTLRTMTNKPLIRAFRVRGQEDLEAARGSSADYVMLDSGAGSGEVFDWSVIREAGRPYFLAGGLNAGNVEQAVRVLHPFAVDVSSGIETDGVKDIKKMAAFAAAVRQER
ncbi:MAG: indole-3-glycerol phosphate synthase TrpC [Lachnospiraceae bacterium]|nr:indole-3-glycerol phosphate synthase TrpC [Lachnospiraceae bacterium]